MSNPFTRHPADIGETYGEHCIHAAGFGSRMVAAGIACIFHGIFPFLFERTGSRQIARLHDDMIANRRRVPEGWSYVI